jgi:biotin carboxyl carrier protein
LAVAGFALWRQAQPQTGGPGGGIAAVRTAVVADGELKKTLRLTGVTAAERYVSLTVPQLRGRRGGGGVTVVAGGGRGGAMMIQASSGGGGGGEGGRSSQQGGGASGEATASAGAATGGAAVASTAGQGAAMAGSSMANFRGSSNRFGGGGASSSSGASSGGSASAGSGSSSASSSGGASASGGGGGSTGGGGGSPGGGGGGGGGMGGDDFSQVLQKVMESGARVKKGDVIAEFDRQFQILRLDDYKSTVEQSERGMKTIDQELVLAKTNREQQVASARAAVEKAKLDIKTTPVRSAIEAESLKLQLEQAEIQLKQILSAVPYQEASEKASRRVSEIDFQTAKTEYRRAEDNIDRMLVKAPMEGMLVMQNTMRGSDFSQIRQGDQLFPGMMFAQIVDPSSMLVTASVNQADVENLRINQKATLRFDAYPGLELPAHVMAIGAITKPGGQRADFFKEIPVFFKIDRMDQRVIPDLSVSVDVEVESASSKVIAPLESIFTEEEGGRTYVYVKTAAGFEKRDVEVDLRNHVRAAVKSGLKTGEVVALERPAPAQPKKDAAGATGNV